MNFDLSFIIGILRDSAFANIVGFIGGLLGLIAFILQLPKKIKPVIYNSDIVNIYLESDDSTIDKIQIEFSLYNNSNRNFLITDIFTKIYENDSYTPSPDIYHVTHIVNNAELINFSSIIVNADSAELYNIELSENSPGKSKKRLYNNRRYTIEMFIVVNNEKMISFPRIDTFDIKAKVNDCIKLKSLTSTLNRDKFEKVIKNRKNHSSFFNGITGRFIKDTRHFIKYKIVKRQQWILRDSIQWIILRPYFIYSFLKYKFVCKTIFTIYGRKSYKNVVTTSVSGHNGKSANTIRQLLVTLTYGVRDINKTSPDIIKITGDDHHINIEKNEYVFHIYIPGSNCIMAHKLEAEPEIFLQFDYRQQYLFSYWKYENKIISTCDMASIILDYFLERTLYKR